MKKTIIVLLTAALLICGAEGAEAAKKKRARAAQPDRFAAIVMEADTGLVISQKNPDRRLYPASLTKMMTLYLTFEAIEDGRLRKNQRMSVSSRASMQEPSKLGLRPGGTIAVEDAIMGLATKSANDAAVVLAEAIGGSEARFATIMTRRARQLGMSSTNFVNASGLHNPNQYSTARDMATLSQALIRDFPRDYRYFRSQSFTYAGIVHRNHNRLMATYPGMDGLKTGYVYASGYNLAASAKRNGQRLIGVIFGGKTTHSRNQQMAALLDDGFQRLNDPRIATAIRQRRDATTAKIAAGSVPGRKPAAEETPTFDAMGLVTEQGDASEGMDAPVATAAARTAEPPRAINIIRPGVNTKLDTAAAAAIARVAERPANVLKLPQPKPIDTSKRGEEIASAAAPKAIATGIWSVQIGAFASNDSGMAALKQAKNKLPSTLTQDARYMISPLMTNRGMIYRARLSGLDRVGATEACRILKGSCLVLATQ